jgi:hypothetical protein
MNNSNRIKSEGARNNFRTTQAIFLIDKVIFQEIVRYHGPVSSSLLRQVGYRAFLIDINLQKIRYAALMNYPSTILVAIA